MTSTAKKSRFAWARKILWAVFLLTLLGSGAAAGTYWYFSQSLPSVEELRNFTPPQVTKVFCKGGVLCAEFYKERRTWVDIRTLPAHVRDAFLAAEDADFYHHEGLDFLGMLRAALKNLRPGSAKSGASTISQQACRNLLLTRDRTLARKIREWILTPRMEKALSKDEILNLYVNFVYFGNNRHGVEEAALFYFGKSAKDLTLGEAAVLAGTVQSPNYKNPVNSIVRAKTRQKYVLGQMKAHHFVQDAKVDAELEKPIVLGPRPPAVVGEYYAEEIRKTLVARYGEKAVLEQGMRVEIAMDVKLQAAAEEAVHKGLEALDRRQGYRGAVGKLDAARFTTLRGLIEQRIAESGKRRPDEQLIADLTALVLKPSPPPKEEDVEDPDEAVRSADERIVAGVKLKSLAENVDAVGWVSKVDDAKGTAQVDLVGRSAELKFASLSWAKRRSPEGKLGNAPVRVSDVVAVGDLVQVRIGKLTTGSAALEAQLAQEPVVQGALLAIDPVDRSVVAMVGGYDFSSSAFNRAVQAKRQPGSSFKPFLYGAAVASTKFTPLSIVNDAPEAVRDPYTGKMWKPQNFEKGGFEGPMTLRMALTKSKNTVSVRLIESLTPATVIEFAQKAGVHSTLPDNLTLALGTGEVSMIEIANAYTTLQSLGQFAEPVTLVKVSDHKGTVLEEHHASFEEVLPPPVAYLTTSLMRSVVEEGTATQVRELERPAAGKTGTAQEYRDAWFTGYTTEYVASAWAGFDGHEPLGPGETGGHAALPLWLEFMKKAHDGLPVRDFAVPPGVIQVRIDPSSGLLAGKSVPGRLESFLEGTAPTTEAPSPGTIDPNDFMLHDGRRGG